MTSAVTFHTPYLEETAYTVMELVNAEPSQANLGESANEAQYFWVCMISPRMFSAKTNSM